MKRHEALPSQYLSKEDFDPPVLCQIATLSVETIKTDRGEERKPVLYVMGPNRALDVTRGIIINGTNWDTLVEITGKEDSEEWEGARIVVYHDTKVMFGGKKVGGIRIRAPKPAPVPAAAKPAAPPPAPEPEYDESNPPLADEDVPF